MATTNRQIGKQRTQNHNQNNIVSNTSTIEASTITNTKHLITPMDQRTIISTG